LLSPALFTAYTWAMSEPLFYLFMVAGLLFLLVYFEKQSRPVLLGCSILAAGAVMTRYIGLAVPAAGIVGLLFLQPANGRKRISDALMFGGLSLGISFLWFIWNFFATGQLGNRLFQPAGQFAASVWEFGLGLAGLAWRWQTLNLPGSASGQLQVALLIFMALLFTLACLFVFRSYSLDRGKRRKIATLGRWVLLFGLFNVMYVSIYFLSFVLTSPQPDLNERIAFPLYLGSLIMLYGMLYFWMEVGSHRWLGLLPWGFTFVLALSFLPQTISEAVVMRRNGIGYTSKSWRESEIIRRVRRLPADLPIVTNEPAAVTFLTGRQSLWISEALGRPVVDPSQRYGDSAPDDLGQTVFRQGGALAIFPSFYGTLEPIYGDKTQARLDSMIDGLVKVQAFGGASGIYFYGPEQVR
jgi:hypothetical protein